MASLKHIVFIKTVDKISGFEKDKFLSELKIKLENLKESIEAIKSIEVGENISKRNTAFDLSLYVEFATENDLITYAAHPEHIKVLNFMRTIKLKTAVVDYIMD